MNLKFHVWTAVLRGPLYEEPGAAGAAGGGTDGGDPPLKPKGVIQMTQEEFNSEIESRLARQKKSLLRELGVEDLSAFKKEREELTDLRTKAREAEEERQRKEGEFDKLAASIRDDAEKRVKSAETQREALLGELRQERCENVILAEAARLGAINPKQVAKLLSGNVQLGEDWRPVVLGDDGKPEYTAGRPLTPAELVTRFATENKHLFGSTKDGAPGATGATGGDGDGGEGGKTDIDKRIEEAKAVYKKSEETAKAAPTPANLAAALAAKGAVKQLEEQRRAAK